MLLVVVCCLVVNFGCDGLLCASGGGSSEVLLLNLSLFFSSENPLAFNAMELIIVVAGSQFGTGFSLQV